MKIRRAVLRDLDLLMDLRGEFNEFHRGLHGMKAASGWEGAYRKELIRELKSKKGLRVIVYIGEEVAGVAFCDIRSNQPGTNMWLESKKYGFIRFLYVYKKFRGLGAATALLEECFGWAKKHGAKTAELMVAVNNHNAHKLYKKLGFTDSAVSMRKRI